MKFEKFTKFFYILGFLFATLIFSSIGMTYSILNLDGKGMAIWGIVVMACGAVIEAIIKEL